MRDIPAAAMTHGGKFHADDVFSAALLRLLRPDIRIHRGFQVPEAFEGLVFDIGLGPFDHHQQDAPVRENGVPYAAFGLLWREFGAAFCRRRRRRGSTPPLSSRWMRTTTPAAATRWRG